MLGTNSMTSFTDKTMPFPPVPRFPYEPMKPGWAPQPLDTDPFMGSGPRPLHDRYATSEDHSMPDYSRSLTPASGQHSLYTVHGLHSQASSNIAGDGPAPDPRYDARFDELVQTLKSSMDKQPRGLVPPHNTQANSVTNTPVVDVNTSSATEMEAVPAWNSMETRKSQTISTPTRLPSPLGVQGRDALSVSTPMYKVKSNPMLSPRPESGSGIKSRKEGHASDADLPLRGKRRASKNFAVLEDKENSTEAAASTSSEGKRKRAENSSTLNELEIVKASPTRKVTRRTESKTFSEVSIDTTGERQRARTPLEGLDNI